MNKFCKREVDNTGSAERSATVLALAGIAVTAYFGQRYHLTEPFPNELRVITDSLAHPVLGFAGAWVGSKIPKMQHFGALAVASLANFSAEISQSLIDKSSLTATWLTHNAMPETTKDYLFALGSLSLYLARNRQPGQPASLW